MQSLVRKELKWVSENNLAFQILQAHAPEWALVQRHTSEDIFGIQVCGGSPQQMGRVAQLVEDGHIDCDFVDINLVKKTYPTTFSILVCMFQKFGRFRLHRNVSERQNVSSCWA